MEHTAEIGSSLSLQLANRSIAGNVKKSINGSEMWEVKMWKIYSLLKNTRGLKFCRI